MVVPLREELVENLPNPLISMDSSSVALPLNPNSLRLSTLKPNRIFALDVEIVL